MHAYPLMSTLLLCGQECHLPWGNNVGDNKNFGKQVFFVFCVFFLSLKFKNMSFPFKYVVCFEAR